MRKSVKYISDDNMSFDTEKECKEHEEYCAKQKSAIKEVIERCNTEIYIDGYVVWRIDNQEDYNLILNQITTYRPVRSAYSISLEQAHYEPKEIFYFFENNGDDYYQYGLRDWIKNNVKFIDLVNDILTAGKLLDEKNRSNKGNI